MERSQYEIIIICSLWIFSNYVPFNMLIEPFLTRYTLIMREKVHMGCNHIDNMSRCAVNHYAAGG